MRDEKVTTTSTAAASGGSAPGAGSRRDGQGRPGGHARHRLDEVIHAPHRLRICVMLAAVDSMDFAAIRDETPPAPAEDAPADPHATAEGGLAEAEEWDPFEDEE